MTDEIRENCGQSWLCIAYAFPPINRSGTHRTLAFVRHLSKLGWNASVIAVEPGKEPVDRTLSLRVPHSTRIIRTKWIDLIANVKRVIPRREQSGVATRRAPDDRAVSTPSPAGRIVRFLSRLLITPDSRIGWIPYGVHAGLEVIRTHRPAVIYSTSPYASAHLIALCLSAWTRVPWVADFRDPWCGNPYRNVEFPIFARFEAWLERLVVRRASHIVCNTPTAREELCARYPFLAGKFSTIANGVDSELSEEIKPIRDEPPGMFVLTHCGQFYGRRSPQVWLAALRLLRERDPIVAARIRFISLGLSHYDGRSLGELAAAEGVSDMFRVVASCGHHESVGRMLGSDALILAGSDGVGAELQVPNKLFEYLSVCRPILATAPTQSPIRSILLEARADCVACEPGDTSSIASAIHALATGQPSADPGLWSGVERFHRNHRAEELAAVFKAVARKDRRGVSGQTVLKSRWAKIIPPASQSVAPTPMSTARSPIGQAPRPMIDSGR